MRHLPADKYNVAWFKLADFVVRGEKERAMGMYRLLMHSIDDKALALQLEGDLLLSFNDEVAQERYRAAALTYIADNRLMEAAAVYEHMITCKTCTNEDLRQLVQVYQELGRYTRLAIHLHELCGRLVVNQALDQALFLIERCHDQLTSAQLAGLYHHLLTCMIANQQPKTAVHTYLGRCMDALTSSRFAVALQTFLTSLEATDAALHEQALRLVEQNS
jgi:hypothetical protein